MQQLDKPFLISSVSMITGILVMSGYLTPKGADALNGIVTFVVGSLIVLLTNAIYHSHNAEVEKAKMKSQTAPTENKTVINTPSAVVTP